MQVGEEILGHAIHITWWIALVAAAAIMVKGK